MPLTAKQKALYFATDTNGTLTGEVDAPPIGRGAHQKILRRPGQIDGQQFIVENLHGCTVHCLDHCAQVTIDKCTDCTFVIGPCADSIFARDCTGCDFGAVCQQWRTRDCSDCTLSLWVPTAPVIESCRGIRVRAWCVAYPSLAAHFEAAGLDSSSPNKIGEVYDFTPPASGESPHWTLEEEGDEAEMTEIVVEGCDLGPCEVRGLSHLEKWGRVVPSPEPCDGDGREL